VCVCVCERERKRVCVYECACASQMSVGCGGGYPKNIKCVPILKKRNELKNLMGVRRSWQLKGCFVSQCAAVFYSVLQCVAACRSVLQCVAVSCSFHRDS